MSYAHLGATLLVNLRAGDEGVRQLQTDLARLGFLRQEASREGIDGKWGTNTANALRAAAQSLRWTRRPFTRSGARVIVPDELLALLQSTPSPGVARSAAPPEPEVAEVVETTPGGVRVTRRPDGSMTLGPLPSEAPSEEDTAPGFPWLSTILLGGVAAGLAWVLYKTVQTPSAPVTANRQRSRR